jgi:hypothetical protein
MLRYRGKCGRGLEAEARPPPPTPPHSEGFGSASSAFLSKLATAKSGRSRPPRSWPGRRRLRPAVGVAAQHGRSGPLGRPGRGRTRAAGPTGATDHESVGTSGRPSSASMNPTCRIGPGRVGEGRERGEGGDVRRARGGGGRGDERGDGREWSGRGRGGGEGGEGMRGRSGTGVEVRAEAGPLGRGRVAVRSGPP